MKCFPILPNQLGDSLSNVKTKCLYICNTTLESFDIFYALDLTTDTMMDHIRSIMVML